MNKKRYSIVRVDNTWCPNKFENINNDFVCTNDYNSPFQKWHCKDCRYGDTKEQLIKKITTVLRREKIKRGLTYYWLATKIVEFLGVE